jgi:4-amino-4-deoxy-L-arabinose transferase-like glycosyltransferase
MLHLKSKSILLFYIAFIFVVIRFVLGFDGLYGQDAYEYLRYTEALKTFFIDGKAPGDYFWGIYYPFLGSLLSFMVPDFSLALQLVSTISLVITTVYLEKTIVVIHKENDTKNIPFLFFTLSPFVFLHGFLAMSDMLACCLIFVSFYYLLNYLETQKNHSFLLGIAIGTLAVMTRYGSFIALLPVGILVAITIFKNRKWGIFVVSIFISLIILLPHLLIRTKNSVEFLSHDWLTSWNFLHLFQSKFTTHEGEINNHFINLIYCCYQFIHPVFLPLGIILIIFFVAKGKSSHYKYKPLLLTTIIVFALFLGGIHYQNKRYLIATMPFVILFLYPIIKQFMTFCIRKKIMHVLLIVVQIGLCFYFGNKYYLRNQLEKKTCREISEYQGNTLYSLDMDVAIQGRKLDFNYQNLYLKEYTSFENKGYVLINEANVEQQWKNRNPMMNWLRLQKYYQLKTIKKLNLDWTLYQIENGNTHTK